jgi:glycine reductase
LERTGIPTAQVTSIIPVALMVGSNRIIAGNKIVNPLGNVDLDPKDEKEVRRAIVEKALKALKTDVEGQTHFDQPTH